MKTVTKAADLPSEEHFAVMKFSTITQDYGVDRRGNHDSYQVPHVEYIAFVNQKEMTDWIIANQRVNSFVVVKTSKVNWSLDVQVKI